MTQYNPVILHPFWVVGFIDGEGCFHVGIARNNTIKLGFQVSLEFSISQHVKDRLLIEKLVYFFGCGYITSDTFSKVQFRIRDREDLEKSLFPFLDKNPLFTTKLLDYQDFKKVYVMMVQGEHLTPNGLEAIRVIQSGMNRNRKFNKS